MEAAIVALRWVQYGGAVVLFGAPLFLLYGFRGGAAPNLAWARPTLAVAAGVVALGAAFALVAQTAVMAGSLSEAVKPASLSAMITGAALGKALIVRAAAALLALGAVAALRPGRALWSLILPAGLAATASFAWTGHGAATEGPAGLVHLAADIVHALAAALWLGALAALTILLLRRTAPDDPGIHRALDRFAGAGTLAVALLALTGLANSWFLVGPARIAALGNTPYGLWLIAKLALFGLMLALAAVNRFRLTPALGLALANDEEPRRELQRLRRSVVAETLAGAALLGVVAVMGTLPPPSAL
jgi:putative copper resistance protein D